MNTVNLIALLLASTFVVPQAFAQSAPGGAGSGEMTVFPKPPTCSERQVVDFGLAFAGDAEKLPLDVGSSTVVKLYTVDRTGNFTDEQVRSVSLFLNGDLAMKWEPYARPSGAKAATAGFPGLWMDVTLTEPENVLVAIVDIYPLCGSGVTTVLTNEVVVKMADGLNFAQ